MAVIVVGGLVLALAGFIMAVVAHLGRRINDHPICRACGFDLHPIYPGAAACPECGGELRREGAVRIGERERQVGMRLAGVVLALVGLSPIGAVIAVTAAGGTLNEYKPGELLLWEARHVEGPTSAPIAEELIARMASKALSPEQVQGAVRAALEMQADRGREWDAAWGDVIDRARLDGTLRVEDLARFRAQAAVFEFKTRESVRAGDPFPFALVLDDYRGSSGGQDPLLVQFQSGAIGGAAASAEEARQANAFGAQVPVWLGWVVFGPGSEDFERRVYGTLSLPSSVAPGQHQVEVKYTADQVRRAMRPGSEILQAQGTITVLPRDAPHPVQLVAASEPARLRLERALRPYYVDVQPGARRVRTRQVTFGFDMRPVQTPVCMDAFLRVNGKEYPLGVLTSGHGQVNPNASFTTQYAKTRVLNARVPKTIDLTRFELVLRPNADAALRTVDLTAVYGGEIVVQGVRPTSGDGAPQQSEEAVRKEPAPGNWKEGWKKLLGD